ncbi:hypothetical protein ABWI04_13905, partial [Actinomadura sp. NPDC000929]
MPPGPPPIGGPFPGGAPARPGAPAPLGAPVPNQPPVPNGTPASTTGGHLAPGGNPPNQVRPLNGADREDPLFTGP